MIYVVGSLCVSFMPVRHREDYRRDVTCVFFLHTLIDLYQYRLMMVTIAGQGRKRVVMLASCNQERSEKAESINSN